MQKQLLNDDDDYYYWPSGCYFDKVENVKHEIPMTFCLFMAMPEYGNVAETIVSKPAVQTKILINQLLVKLSKIDEKNIFSRKKLKRKLEMFDVLNKCEECDNLYYYEISLKCHKLKCHELGDFGCIHCDKSYYHRSGLRRHMRRKH